MHWLNSSIHKTPDFGDHIDLVSTSTPELSWRIVSETTAFYFKLILDYWILLLISILGIVTNIINIIVFHRQGFQETINISLLYIAIWDLIKSITGVMFRLHRPLGLADTLLGLNWENETWAYLTYISLYSGYVTYALAAYVSIARCLCVVYPFKVKFILNRRFTLMMVNGLSLAVFGAYSFMFSFYSVLYQFSASYNMSLPRAQCNNFCRSHPELGTFHKLLSIILPSVCFLILCTSSAVTVSYLRKSHKIHYRSSDKEHGREKPSASISRKEAQVAKTVLTIIGVYIGNLFPRIVGNYIPSLIEPEYYLRGKYHHMFVFVADTVSVLDAINSSINFFIFLSMSTNFKTAFHQVFPACKRKMVKEESHK